MKKINKKRYEEEKRIDKLFQNLSNIGLILLILIIMPISTYANSNTNYNVNTKNNQNYCNRFEVNLENNVKIENNIIKSSKINSKKENEFKLEDAEIQIMMNTRGTLISSHSISDFNNNPVYIIKIKENNKMKTYLVEKEENPKLIEEENI